MAEESDGIEEALESTVRLAAMAGARLGAEIARAHEDRLREQRRADAREADRLAQRFEAEKQAAILEVSQVHRPDWWERADAERIGQTYATARAWAPEANEAARAEHKMRVELRDRYGVDVGRHDPRTVTADIEAWKQRLEQQRRQTAEQARATETAEAAALLAQAARDDRRADAASKSEPGDARAEFLAGAWDRKQESVSTDSVEGIRARSGDTSGRSTREAERLYDSADRRTADAVALTANGIDPEVAESRMHADTVAGAPATGATAGVGRGRAPRARKAAGRGAQIQRAGVER